MFMLFAHPLYAPLRADACVNNGTRDAAAKQRQIENFLVGQSDLDPGLYGVGKRV
jgi:hypothetical protein